MNQKLLDIVRIIFTLIAIVLRIFIMILVLMKLFGHSPTEMALLLSFISFLVTPQVIGPTILCQKLKIT